MRGFGLTQGEQHDAAKAAKRKRAKAWLCRQPVIAVVYSVPVAARKRAMAGVPPVHGGMGGSPTRKGRQCPS
jgi:hypothetical protein